MTRPPIHVLISGKPHSGKSCFARTMPTPQLIFMFDYFGKDLPYLQLGRIEELEPQPCGTAGLLTPTKRVWQGDKLMCQIEYYHEPFPEQPNAYKRFLTRMAGIHAEAGIWATYTVDSLTTQQMVGLAHEKALNPEDRMTMIRYANIVSSIEETLMMRFGGIPANVCVIAHEVEKEETKTERDRKGNVVQIGTGKYLRGINAFGRLHSILPAGFGEYYRMRRETGKFFLQTEPEGAWSASSSLRATNRCEPNYEALWTNYKELEF